MNTENKTIKKKNLIFGWIEGLRLGIKLSFGFGLVLIFSLTIGGFSLERISQVNNVSNGLAKIWMPNILHTTSIRSLILEIRDLEIKYARATDTGYMDEYEEKIKKMLDSVKRENDLFINEKIDERSRKLFDQFHKNWDVYLMSSKKVFNLSRAKKQDDAKDISDGASKSAHDDAIAALDAVTTYCFDEGKKSAENAQQVFVNARMLITIMLGFALIVGVFFATVITRNLLHKMGGEPAYASEVTAAIAQGKLYLNIRLKKGDISSLLAGILDMRNGIVKIVKDVRNRAEHIAVSSQKIDRRNADLSARTDQQTQLLKQTSESIANLSSAVRKNADGANLAKELARNASDIAFTGGTIMAQVVDTMKEINNSSRKISNIISMVDAIAFQTNILALNAAVEAARAGEQGRGFAVVASEVRNLAGRSASAAKEIKDLVSASLQGVEKGTNLVDRAGTTMTEVVSAIRHVTDLIANISSASEAQSQDVIKVGCSIHDMDETTQRNSALVEEMAGDASNLSSQAAEMLEAAATFVLTKEDDSRDMNSISKPKLIS